MWERKFVYFLKCRVRNLIWPFLYVRTSAFHHCLMSLISLVSSHFILSSSAYFSALSFFPHHYPDLSCPSLKLYNFSLVLWGRLVFFIERHERKELDRVHPQSVLLRTPFYKSLLTTTFYIMSFLQNALFTRRPLHYVLLTKCTLTICTRLLQNVLITKITNVV
jgi:hypothetical protein